MSRSLYAGSAAADERRIVRAASERKRLGNWTVALTVLLVLTFCLWWTTLRAPAAATHAPKTTAGDVVFDGRGVPGR